MIQQRNIAVCVILSIVTLGIYSLIWFIKLSDDTNLVTTPPTNGKPHTSGGMALLLTIVTCGIYGYYWAYRQGEKLDNAKSSKGMPTSNQSLIYLLLEIFGLGIVAWALMQSQLNEMATPQSNMQKHIKCLLDVSGHFSYRIFVYGEANERKKNGNKKAVDFFGTGKRLLYMA